MEQPDKAKEKSSRRAAPDVEADGDFDYDSDSNPASAREEKLPASTHADHGYGYANEDGKEPIDENYMSYAASALTAAEMQVFQRGLYRRRKQLRRRGPPAVVAIASSSIDLLKQAAAIKAASPEKRAREKAAKRLDDERKIRMASLQREKLILQMQRLELAEQERIKQRAIIEMQMKNGTVDFDAIMHAHSISEKQAAQDALQRDMSSASLNSARSASLTSPNFSGVPSASPSSANLLQSPSTASLSIPSSATTAATGSFPSMENDEIPSKLSGAISSESLLLIEQSNASGDMANLEYYRMRFPKRRVVRAHRHIGRVFYIGKLMGMRCSHWNGDINTKQKASTISVPASVTASPQISNSMKGFEQTDIKDGSDRNIDQNQHENMIDDTVESECHCVWLGLELYQPHRLGAPLLDNRALSVPADDEEWTGLQRAVQASRNGASDAAGGIDALLSSSDNGASTARRKMMARLRIYLSEDEDHLARRHREAPRTLKYEQDSDKEEEDDVDENDENHKETDEGNQQQTTGHKLTKSSQASSVRRLSHPLVPPIALGTIGSSSSSSLNTNTPSNHGINLSANPSLTSLQTVPSAAQLHPTQMISPSPSLSTLAAGPMSRWQSSATLQSVPSQALLSPVPSTASLASAISTTSMPVYSNSPTEEYVNDRLWLKFQGKYRLLNVQTKCDPDRAYFVLASITRPVQRNNEIINQFQSSADNKKNSLIYKLLPELKEAAEKTQSEERESEELSAVFQQMIAEEEEIREREKEEQILLASRDLIMALSRPPSSLRFLPAQPLPNASLSMSESPNSNNKVEADDHDDDARSHHSLSDMKSQHQLDMPKLSLPLITKSPDNKSAKTGGNKSTSRLSSRLPNLSNSMPLSHLSAKSSLSRLHPPSLPVSRGVSSGSNEYDYQPATANAGGNNSNSIYRHQHYSFNIHDGPSTEEHIEEFARKNEMKGVYALTDAIALLVPMHLQSNVQAIVNFCCKTFTHKIINSELKKIRVLFRFVCNHLRLKATHRKARLRAIHGVRKDLLDQDFSTLMQKEPRPTHDSDEEDNDNNNRQANSARSNKKMVQPALRNRNNSKNNNSGSDDDEDDERGSRQKDRKEKHIEFRVKPISSRRVRSNNHSKNPSMDLTKGANNLNSSSENKDEDDHPSARRSSIAGKHNQGAEAVTPTGATPANSSRVKHVAKNFVKVTLTRDNEPDHNNTNAASHPQGSNGTSTGHRRSITLSINNPRYQKLYSHRHSVSMMSLSTIVTDLLEKKETDSHGFAVLFQALCFFAGIPCIIIRGLKKKGLETSIAKAVNTSSYISSSLSIQNDLDGSGSANSHHLLYIFQQHQRTSDHYWNLCYLPQAARFIIIDCASSAGFLSAANGEFIKAFTSAYFHIDPNVFSLSHFPLMAMDFNTLFLLYGKTTIEGGDGFLNALFHDFFNDNRSMQLLDTASDSISRSLFLNGLVISRLFSQLSLKISPILSTTIQYTTPYLSVEIDGPQWMEVHCEIEIIAGPDKERMRKIHAEKKKRLKKKKKKREKHVNKTNNGNNTHNRKSNKTKNNDEDDDSNEIITKLKKDDDSSEDDDDDESEEVDWNWEYERELEEKILNEPVDLTTFTKALLSPVLSLPPALAASLQKGQTNQKDLFDNKSDNNNNHNSTSNDTNSNPNPIDMNNNDGKKGGLQLQQNMTRSARALYGNDYPYYDLQSCWHQSRSNTAHMQELFQNIPNVDEDSTNKTNNNSNNNKPSTQETPHKPATALSRKTRLRLHFVFPVRGCYLITVSMKRISNQIMVFEKLMQFTVTTHVGVFDLPVANPSVSKLYPHPPANQNQNGSTTSPATSFMTGAGVLSPASATVTTDSAGVETASSSESDCIPQPQRIFVGFLQSPRSISIQLKAVVSQIQLLTPLRGFFELNSKFMVSLLAPPNVEAMIVCSNGRWRELKRSNAPHSDAELLQMVLKREREVQRAKVEKRRKELGLDAKQLQKARLRKQRQQHAAALIAAAAAKSNNKNHSNDSTSKSAKELGSSTGSSELPSFYHPPPAPQLPVTRLGDRMLFESEFEMNDPDLHIYLFYGGKYHLIYSYTYRDPLHRQPGALTSYSSRKRIRTEKILPGAIVKPKKKKNEGNNNDDADDNNNNNSDDDSKPPTLRPMKSVFVGPNRIRHVTTIQEVYNSEDRDDHTVSTISSPHAGRVLLDGHGRCFQALLHIQEISFVGRRLHVSLCCKSDISIRATLVKGWLSGAALPADVVEVQRTAQDLHGIWPASRELWHVLHPKFVHRSQRAVGATAAISNDSVSNDDQIVDGPASENASEGDPRSTTATPAPHGPSRPARRPHQTARSIAEAQKQSEERDKRIAYLESKQRLPVLDRWRIDVLVPTPAVRPLATVSASVEKTGVSTGSSSKRSKDEDGGSNSTIIDLSTSNAPAFATASRFMYYNDEADLQRDKDRDKFTVLVYISATPTPSPLDFDFGNEVQLQPLPVRDEPNHAPVNNSGKSMIGVASNQNPSASSSAHDSRTMYRFAFAYNLYAPIKQKGLTIVERARRHLQHQLGR